MILYRSSSTALRTNDMWSKTIGYDPYANKSEDAGAKEALVSENAAGLLLLAKMSNVSGADTTRGACKRCNMMGHLTFQCRNAPAVPEKALDDVRTSKDLNNIYFMQHVKITYINYYVMQTQSSDDDSSSSSSEPTADVLPSAGSKRPRHHSDSSDSDREARAGGEKKSKVSKKHKKKDKKHKKEKKKEKKNKKEKKHKKS